MKISKHSSLLLTISVLSLVSCSEAIPQIDKRVTVTFIDNAATTFSSQIYKIEKGQDLKVSFKIKEGYYFKDCSYKSYSYELTDNFSIELTLKNIKYNLRVSLETPELGGVIHYYLNGGSFIKETTTGDHYSVPYEERAYRRPNLDIGTSTIYRDGYELTGWNSKADGTGVHIGLGSRATIDKDNLPLFYAEWVKDNELTDFEYESNENGITLTKYLGTLNGDKLVVPSKINGQKVTQIGSYFANGATFDKLYLPSYLTTIANRAFIKSNFNEVYLFDNILDMKDLSFSNTPIKTWHINAIQYPRYGIGGIIGELPDDFDRLILKNDKKRIVLAGGCSLSYGIKTPVMQKFFEDYYIINTGVIAEIGPIPVFGALAHYLKDDDIVIHAPEEASENQYLSTIKAEARAFACFRGNYDLLSYCDMTKMSETYGAFAASNTINLDHEDEGGYDRIISEYNEYGEVTTERPGLNNDVGLSDGEYTYNTALINDTTGKRLRTEYEMVEKSGAEVVFSFAPLNKSNLTKDDLNNEIWKEFEAKCHEQFDAHGYKVISKVEDYLYPGRYFYDEDYHLTDIGAEMRSEKLAKDILAYLGRDAQ